MLIYIYAECLLEKINTCQNDPNKPSTTKINTHHWVIQYLHNVHLMNQKINLIIIEKMIA